MRRGLGAASFLVSGTVLEQKLVDPLCESETMVCGYPGLAMDAKGVGRQGARRVSSHTAES